jgi:hypothetical protein
MMRGPKFLVSEWLLIAGLIAVVLIAICEYAWSKPPEGLPPDPARAEWFRAQVIPGTELSCCNEADGRVTQSRPGGPSGVEVYLTHKLWPDSIDQDHWEPVPDNTILQHQPNPTGGTVVWVSPGWTPMGHNFPRGSILCTALPAQG